MKGIMLAKAIAFAARVHEGQRDKSGAPYIFHPVRVAAAFSDETLQTIAVLHDVIEDCGVTRYDLSREFSIVVADAVQALTRQEGESYEDFITRVALNPTSRLVKIADIRDNLRPGAEHLRGRYERALQALGVDENEPMTTFQNDQEREDFLAWVEAGKPSLNLELLDALKRANDALKTASRQLTEDHRMVLMGRGWGWRTLALVEGVIAKAESHS